MLSDILFDRQGNTRRPWIIVMFGLALAFLLAGDAEAQITRYSHAYAEACAGGEITPRTCSDMQRDHERNLREQVKRERELAEAQGKAEKKMIAAQGERAERLAEAHIDSTAAYRTVYGPNGEVLRRVEVGTISVSTKGRRSSLFPTVYYPSVQPVVVRAGPTLCGGCRRY